MKHGKLFLMTSLVTSKRYLGALFLLFFLFSTNVLSYGAHLAKEAGHDHNVHDVHIEQCANHGSSLSFTDGAKHHHDGDRDAQHGEGESCCHSHSHASILQQPLGYKHVPQISLLRSIEPFRFTPEVYLDKFIPPAELV